MALEPPLGCPWPDTPVGVVDGVAGFRSSRGLVHLTALPLDREPVAGSGLVGAYATAELDLAVRPEATPWRGMPGGQSGLTFLVVWLAAEHVMPQCSRPRFDVRRWVYRVAASRGDLVQVVWVCGDTWWLDSHGRESARSEVSGRVPLPPADAVATRAEVLARWGVAASARAAVTGADGVKPTRQVEATWLRYVGGARRDWAPGAWRDFVNAPQDGPTVRLGAALTDRAFRDAVLWSALPGADADAQHMALHAPPDVAADWLDGMVVPAVACRPGADVQARFAAALGPLLGLSAPVIRAEAGAVLAWLAWWHADYAAANALLAVCSDLGHQLSRILWDGLAHGLPTAWQRVGDEARHPAGGGFSANPPRMP